MSILYNGNFQSNSNGQVLYIAPQMSVDNWILDLGNLHVCHDGVILNSGHIKHHYDENSEKFLLKNFRGHILVFSVSYDALSMSKGTILTIGISDGSFSSIMRTNETSGTVRVSHRISYDAVMIQPFIDTTDSNTSIKIHSASLEPWNDKFIQESMKG